MPSKTNLSDVYSTILDNIKPTKLFSTINRLNSTSRYYRDIDIGNENREKILFDSNHFAYKDEYILENKEFKYRKNSMNQITYMGIPLLNIIKLIIKNEFLFIFDDRKTIITFKKNKFYFNAILPTNDKYSSDKYYARCECSLYINRKNIPIFKIIKSYPELEENETLNEFMEDDDKVDNIFHQQPIYYQDIPIIEMNLFWKDKDLPKIKKITIDRFVIENVKENKGFIEISYK